MTSDAARDNYDDSLTGDVVDREMVSQKGNDRLCGARESPFLTRESTSARSGAL